jgi:Flp pilus assembly pilin Flp
MKRLMVRLWNDDTGALIATEWLFIVTIMVIGLITGLAIVRNSVVAELEEVAGAILSLNQSYSFTGLKMGPGERKTGSRDTEDSIFIAHTAGSIFVDPRNVVGVAKNTAAFSNIRGAEELGEPLN